MIVSNSISRYPYNRITLPIFLSQNNFPEKKADLLGNELNGTTCNEISFPSLGLYIEKRKITGVMISNIHFDSSNNKEVIRDITRLILFKTLYQRLPQILQTSLLNTTQRKKRKKEMLDAINEAIEKGSFGKLIEELFPKCNPNELKLINAQLAHKHTTEEILASLLSFKRVEIQANIKKTIHQQTTDIPHDNAKEQLIFQDLIDKTVNNISPVLLEHIFLLPEDEREILHKKIFEITNNYYELTTCFEKIEELLHHIALFAPPFSIGWQIHEIKKEDLFPSLEVLIQAAAHGNESSALIQTIEEKFEALRSILGKYNISCECTQDNNTTQQLSVAIFSLQI